MKKFLTVLLVIAVMFTFSFSSAFAAGMGDNYTASIGDPAFETMWAETVKITTDSDYITVTSKTDKTIDVDKAVLAGFKAEAKALYDYYMVYVTTGSYFTDAATLQADVLDIANAYTTDDTWGKKQEAFKLALAAAQYAAERDDALAMVGSVPTYNYSSEVMSDTDAAKAENMTKVGGVVQVVFVDKDYTYAQAAEKLVKFYEDQIKKVEKAFDADTDFEDYETAIETTLPTTVLGNAFQPLGYATYNTATPAKVTGLALTGAYDFAELYTGLSAKSAADGFTFPAAATGGVFIDVNNDVNDWSTAAIEAGNKTDAASIAAVKAQNAANYASFVVGKDAETVKKADKWLKVADALAEAGYKYVGEAEAPKIKAPTDADTLADYVTAADEMAKLEYDAARYAAEKNADGVLIRDAAVVQKLLKKGLEAIAASTIDGTVAIGDVNEPDEFYVYYSDLIKDAVSEVIASELAFTKDSVKKATELLLADAVEEETYFAAELADVQKLVDKYLAKVDAAEKNADAKVYEALLAEIDSDVPTAEGLIADWKTNMEGDGKAEKVIYDAAAAYVTYYNNNVAAETTDQLNNTKLKDRIAEMIGESGVRTQAEIKKLTSQAVEVAKGLPTNADVTAAKKAVVAAVKALPAKATVADLALVQAASDAIDAYQDLDTDALTTETAGYTTAVGQVIAAYNTQFAQTYAKTTKTDEAALNALYDEIDAVVETLLDLDGVEDADVAYLTGLQTSISNYLGTIKTKEAEAVEKLIKAIPINVTEADKATVEAARAAYDAYVAKYTDLEALYYEESYTEGFAANDIDGLNVLTAAETVLGLNAPDPEENAKAYVQDLKIAARSVKTSKGVKVTINADVQPLLDDGFTVEYKFYRSTKSNAKFGSPKITKTTNTYLNTSGKKGTRYYYKARLVVKNAKGEVVAITPLSQCLYATRVF